MGLSNSRSSRVIEILNKRTYTQFPGDGHFSEQCNHGLGESGRLNSKMKHIGSLGQRSESPM